jgi:DNA modification methylase
MTIRKEVIGDATLYCGSMEDVLPTLGRFDACVTDPPYGIDYGRAGGFSASHGWGSWRENVAWDKERPDRRMFDMILSVSTHQIVWGGNYFTDYLPPTMQWLVWDKGQRDFSLADCEFAWSSQRKAARIINFPRARALQDGKEHPTQKPVGVMEWCLSHLPADVVKVVDPFAGSGTTGVACVKRGLTFTGIEREPRYFEIALRRIEQAYAQPRLALEPPPKPVQTDMLGGAA